MDAAVVCISSGGGGIEGYRHCYLEGMRSVARWLESAWVGTLIYTSSTSVYPQDGGVMVDETSELNANLIQEKPALLIETEQIVLRACLGAQRRCVLRLAGLYGPGRHLLMDQMRVGTAELPGLGNQHLNLVNRDDAMQAVLGIWCIKNAGVSPQIFNVVDDGAATREEITGWLAKRFGTPAPKFTRKQDENRRRTSTDRIIRNDKLKAMIGWRPWFPSYREGYEAILSAL